MLHTEEKNILCVIKKTQDDIPIPVNSPHKASNNIQLNINRNLLCWREPIKAKAAVIFRFCSSQNPNSIYHMSFEIEPY